MRGASSIICLAGILCPGTLQAQETVDRAIDRTVDVVAYFQRAQEARGAGLAHKTKPVDARPAAPGEVIVTMIKGEGKETQSPPAKPGDMVIRNRCPETGNEEILSFGRVLLAPL